MMKKLLALLLSLLLCVPALAFADAESDQPAMPFSLAEWESASSATLKVIGSASVSVQPDSAQVSVGVETQAETMEEASAQNAETVRKVIEALKNVGVADADIATNYYSVNTDYDYETRALRGYRVSNTLNVILRDMTSIGATMDAASAAGANSMYGVTFLSSKQAEAQDVALEKAIADAMRKAELMAKAAGREVGELVSVSEGSDSYVNVYTNYKGEAAMDSAGNVILPDNLSISAAVTLVYELK